MGLFDNIKCELPLPFNKKEQKTFSNVNWDDQVFQTKDTDCTMSTYTIRKNGKLYGLFIQGENVRIISKKEENKIKKQGKFCWPYKFKEKSRKHKFEKFTGELYFYDSLMDIDGNEWWVEFLAKFVDGVLQGKIKKKEVRFSHSKEDLKKQEEKFNELMEADKRKFHNKFRKFMNKITFNYWRFIWWNISKIVNKFSNKIHNLDIFINRYIA